MIDFASFLRNIKCNDKNVDQRIVRKGFRYEDYRKELYYTAQAGE